MMLLIFTESTRQELASLIASFNKAWNHVRLNLDQQGTILLCSVIPLHMFTPGSSLIANNCLTLVEFLRRLDCFEGDWAPLAKSNKEFFAVTAIWVIQWTVNYAIHSILSRFDELSWHNESTLTSRLAANLSCWKQFLQITPENLITNSSNYFSIGQFQPHKLNSHYGSILFVAKPFCDRKALSWHPQRVLQD